MRMTVTPMEGSSVITPLKPNAIRLIAICAWPSVALSRAKPSRWRCSWPNERTILMPPSVSCR